MTPHGPRAFYSSRWFPIACAWAAWALLASGCRPATETGDSMPLLVNDLLEEAERTESIKPRDLDPSLSASERKVVEDFLRLFALKKDSLFPNRWLDIPTLQNPNDVWVTQEIISEVKPDLIVETGTYRGGSAAIWAMVLDQVNPDARVISIDIKDNLDPDRLRGTFRLAKTLPIVKERVEFVIGSSTDPDVVAHVKKAAEGKRLMVILDSAHTPEHVSAELAAYAPMIDVGSYLIVQDTGGVMIQDPNPGPRQAVDQFLASHPEFEPDRYRERMLHTLHPKGYLRRKE